MEPAVGLEPTASGLRNRCSAAELRWLEWVLYVPSADAEVCLSSSKRIGAGDGVRTRGLRLGKPTFYH